MQHLPNFQPAWWLNNRHLQTIWQEIIRKPNKLPLRHERFELACGDFLDLEWLFQERRDTVIVLHGLGGSIKSSYVAGMLSVLADQGFNAVALHFRGCGRQTNRHAEVFHGGQTEDLAEVVKKLSDAGHRIFLVGFSIGGNILLKYLGEQGKKSPVAAAVAISVPFLLAETQQNLSKGFSRIYQHYLLLKLKMILLKKKISRTNNNISLSSLLVTKSIREFDDAVTAPLHGFDDAKDYYARASCYSYLQSITTPTLIIHAQDDPFFPEEFLPAVADISKSTEILLTKNGGHVGFISGSFMQPRYWLEHVVPIYFEQKLKDIG